MKIKMVQKRKQMLNIILYIKRQILNDVIRAYHAIA